MLDILNNILTEETSTFDIHRAFLGSGVKITRKELMAMLKENAVFVRSRGKMKYWKRKE